MQSITHISQANELPSVWKNHDLIEQRIFVLCDSQTHVHCFPRIKAFLPKKGRRAHIMVVEEGESSKTLATAEHLYNQLIEHEADRSSVLLNLGGGMICDLGSFVASTFKRGMQWINIPTTVLGQVDAAIGGKTGVDHQQYKNIIGTFALAKDTLILPELLNTLPKREVMAGFAEMVKHSLIAAPDSWKQMRDTTYLDLPFIQSQIKDSIAIKKAIVEIDFEEKGERKKLNFGHTIGHALESLMLESGGQDLLHGEAVALGMMAETYISYAKGYISETLLKEINAFIGAHYRGLKVHESQFHRLIEIIRQDKKNVNGRINMTLLKGIGNAVYDRNPHIEQIIDSLIYLERFPFKK